jgi:pyruvate formate lyase activating enzyme
MRWEASELAAKLLRDQDFFTQTGGGVTLSGGEPLLQWEFCEELLTHLRGKIHTAIETSGHAAPEVFARIVALCDFVYMDLKLADSELHRRYTGVDNTLILQNFAYLKASNIPHTFRTPLIPNITDTPENLSAIAALVGESSWEKLPYNTLAPAKYPCVGRTFPC